MRATNYGLRAASLFIDKPCECDACESIARNCQR